ncbi:MAG TPA: sigma-54 dependent transcriptional regulator [Polyangiaceae bacterium]|nr:sigma-54 dependent transcriptional regulator [Polyangiaceae bacterium]
MGANLDRVSEQFSEGELDPAGQSQTRLRAATPVAFREPPSACLVAAGRPLQLLALRLIHAGERFERTVFHNWRTTLHEQSERTARGSDGALDALLRAVQSGHDQAAQDITVAWFDTLVRDGIGLPSITLLIEAIEDGARSMTNDEQALAQVREFGRFLTRVAVLTFVDPGRLEPLLQSGVIEREPAAQDDLGLVGASPAIERLRQELRDIGELPGSVLLVGESGTGKELAARALHELGGGDRPFIALNCAALPRELFESELFGHERGSFTGSRDASLGLLRAAQNGTIFLDEITEMPEALQPKLLRALEQRMVRPVGGVREFPFRARVVAATNRDPTQAIQSGHFRADLFFRLCVHRVSLPSLRERRADIAALSELFLRQLSKAGHRVSLRPTDAALTELCGYGFPGNVRELRNVIEHGVAVARGAPLEPRHLPRYLQRTLSMVPPPSPGRTPSAPALMETQSGAAPKANRATGLAPLHQVEREHILQALEQANGNKAQAARLLGVSRHQLYSKLERLGLPATT